MRRFVALYTLFFFVCSFGIPQESKALLPIGLIAAASIGAATLAAAGVGIHYTKNGTIPQYVEAVQNAVATANDYIYVATDVAAGVYRSVTASSYPDSIDFYLGKSAALGAKVGDIFNYAAQHGYTALNTLLNTVQIEGAGDGTSLCAGITNLWQINPKGKIFTGSGGNYLVPQTGYWDWISSTHQVTEATAETYIDGPKVNIAFTTISGENSYATHGWLAMGKLNGVPRLFMWVTSTYYTANPVIGDFVYWRVNLTITTDDPTFPPGVSTTDYPALKEALKSATVDQNDELKDVITKLPPAVTTGSGEIPTTAGTATTAPTITQAEVDQWFKQNTADVARAAADAAAAAAAADPTNAALQAAAAQAAVDAARAAQDAARPAKEDYFADAPSLDIPEIKEVDFSPVTGLAGEMTSIFPFGLIESIRSAMVPFSATPQTPSFDIDLGFVRQTITFSSFDGVASFVRGLASFFFYCLTGLFCFRLYSRM